MYQVRPNPFADNKTYSSSYSHDLSSTSYYFPSTSSSSTHKPSFLVGKCDPFPSATGNMYSPYHDYKSWSRSERSITSSTYKQNPFYKGHLLENAEYLPKNASVYSSEIIYHSHYNSSSPYQLRLDSELDESQVRGYIPSRNQNNNDEYDYMPQIGRVNSMPIGTQYDRPRGQDRDRDRDGKVGGGRIWESQTLDKVDKPLKKAPSLGPKKSSSGTNKKLTESQQIQNDFNSPPSFNSKGKGIFVKGNSSKEQMNRPSSVPQQDEPHQPDSPAWPKIDRGTSAGRIGRDQYPSQIAYRGRNYYLMRIDDDSVVRF